MSDQELFVSDEENDSSIDTGIGGDTWIFKPCVGSSQNTHCMK